jgi:hypothetical protein
LKCNFLNVCCTIQTYLNKSLFVPCNVVLKAVYFYSLPFKVKIFINFHLPFFFVDQNVQVFFPKHDWRQICEDPQEQKQNGVRVDEVTEHLFHKNEDVDWSFQKSLLFSKVTVDNALHQSSKYKY